MVSVSVASIQCLSRARSSAEGSPWGKGGAAAGRKDSSLPQVEVGHQQDSADAGAQCDGAGSGESVCSLFVRTELDRVVGHGLDQALERLSSIHSNRESSSFGSRDGRPDGRPGPGERHRGAPGERAGFRWDRPPRLRGSAPWAVFARRR